jgi:uncharacterized protein
MKAMMTFFCVLLVGYGALLAGMYAFQRQLMYFPDKNIAAPSQYGLQGFSELRVQATDGITLQLWHRAPEAGMPTVLYFHGNASHIGNRAGIYSALAGKGLGVLALSYRGYGKSEGSPTEQGLYTDARTAIDYAVNTLGVPLDKLVIYGESLGTGVSVQMATEFKVGALVLQAPYTSVVGRAAEIYFYVPVRLLIHDAYDSLSKMARVHSPLLLLHGELDQTIPVAHGRALFAAANQPKEAIFFPDVEHNNFDSSLVASQVLRFARAQGMIQQ